MSGSRTRAIAANEIAVARCDPYPFLFMVLLPIAGMFFLKEAIRPALGSLGHEGATGAEQVVPGMTVLFSFFVVGFVAHVFFRDHRDHTWDRLRLVARPAEIFVGKLALPFATLVYQHATAFVAGGLLLGLHVSGDLGGIVIVSAAFLACLTALGVAVAGVCRTLLQVDAVSQMLAGSAGFSGAFVPLETLPQALRWVAPMTPGYWAMRGYHTVILEGGGIAEAAVSACALVAFALAFALVALLCFRFEDAKSA